MRGGENADRAFSSREMRIELGCLEEEEEEEEEEEQECSRGACAAELGCVSNSDTARPGGQRGREGWCRESVAHLCLGRKKERDREREGG